MCSLDGRGKCKSLFHRKEGGAPSRPYIDIVTPFGAKRPLCGRTPLLRPLAILAIETSMRRGELLDLRWNLLDLRHAVVPSAADKKW
jgi:integrase